jgi:hypothetical protein
MQTFTVASSVLIPVRVACNMRICWAKRPEFLEPGTHLQSFATKAIADVMFSTYV